MKVNVSQIRWVYCRKCPCHVVRLILCLNFLNLLADVKLCKRLRDMQIYFPINTIFRNWEVFLLSRLNFLGVCHVNWHDIDYSCIKYFL